MHNHQIVIMPIVESKQRGIQSFSQFLHRELICTHLSIPMADFGIKLLEKTSLEDKFIPIDTMLKFNNQKINQFWKVLLLIDLENQHLF